MSDLLANQKIFASQAILLLKRIDESGLQFTFGATFREGDPLLHGKRLAIDINLFDKDKYLTDVDSHRQFGEYWKSLDPLNRWGGDFRPGTKSSAFDGNHYSRAYGGMA
jgi:hypothetical protein